MVNCIRCLMTLALVVALGSPVLAAAPDSIPDTVVSFARSLSGSIDPGVVRATPVPGLYAVPIPPTSRLPARPAPSGRGEAT